MPTPLGTSAFEPASIVGLEAVSWTSPVAAPARFGAAQRLPAPANGAVVPIAQTSLLAAVTFAPGVAPNPPTSVAPAPVFPATIEF